MGFAQHTVGSVSNLFVPLSHPIDECFQIGDEYIQRQQFPNNVTSSDSHGRIFNEELPYS